MGDYKPIILRNLINYCRFFWKTIAVWGVGGPDRGRVQKKFENLDPFLRNLVDFFWPK